MTTTAQTPHPAVVALPPKAVKGDDWEPYGADRFYRHCEAENREVVTGAGAKLDAHAVVVVAHAVQYDDGSIDHGTDAVLGAPTICLETIDRERGWTTDIGVVLTGEAARQLADVLVTAADEVDGWSVR